MLKVLLARARQGCRTVPFPVDKPVLPALFRGLPLIDHERCAQGCESCAEVCPTDAIDCSGEGMRLDLGRCLFCNACTRACPEEAIHFSQEHRLATSQRDTLKIDGGGEPQPLEALGEKLRQLLGRSLRLRQVSAGGCNGCEVEANALGNIIFDSGRFGIDFVPSPRHADGLLITGPVTENMRAALLDTYAAVADPRLVIASGACAISGGPYRGHPEVHDGVDSQIPVDLYIPGCPPHPYTLLDGLLRLLGR